MTESDERRPTADEEAMGRAVTGSIDIITDLIIKMGIASAGDVDDAISSAVVIAEGTLARLLSAFCRAHQTDDIPLEMRDARAAEMLDISVKHVRDVFTHYWAMIRALPDPDET